MRLRSIAFALCVGGLASGSPEQVQAVLTTIDTIPSQVQLNHAFGDDPLQAAVGLGAIAQDADADLGIRLRSIHALSRYCTAPCNETDTAHVVLTGLVDTIEERAASAPLSEVDLVILRAALEALGPQRVVATPGNTTDVDRLIAALPIQSRDVRAAAVHGLRDLCNTQAITPLGQLQATETSKQVLQAITEALRVLRTDPCQ